MTVGGLAPPDGGWGWAVVLAGFVQAALVFGVLRSFGVFFVAFVVHFGEPAGAVSWVPAIAVAVQQFASEAWVPCSGGERGQGGEPRGLGSVGGGRWSRPRCWVNPGGGGELGATAGSLEAWVFWVGGGGWELANENMGGGIGSGPP